MLRSVVVRYITQSGMRELKTKELDLVCCSVLRSVAVRYMTQSRTRELQIMGLDLVCCSVLQSVAVCCGLLQCGI